MKVYIPFNMIVDTDFGVVRLLEKVQGTKPLSTNKIKSFLLKRKNENPIPEFCELLGMGDEISSYAYEVMMDKFYTSVLKLSAETDLISFIINTYKFGLNNEVEIVVGCDEEIEIKYLNSLLRNMKLSINCILNSDVKLDEFHSIFVKVIDQAYIDYLIGTAKISGKRIYVADYSFNTLYDKESEQKIIHPMYQIQLENEGNVLCTVSLYNKRRK